MDLGLKGKTALIAASSKGLGKATAIVLAEEGCRVAVCARHREELATTAEEIRNGTGAEVLDIVCDLSDGDAITRMFDKRRRLSEVLMFW